MDQPAPEFCKTYECNTTQATLTRSQPVNYYTELMDSAYIDCAHLPNPIYEPTMCNCESSEALAQKTLNSN